MAICLLVQACALADPGEPARKLWSAHVEQILTDHCTKCHAGVKQKAGVDLRTPQTVLKGGDNGSIVIPGDSKNSRLLKVLSPGADPHMPPEGSKQLNDEQVAIIQRWIDRLPSTNQPGGQVDWSAPIYAAAKPVNMPKWAGKVETTEAINRFVEQGWKERKAKPAPLANDNAFVRRLYLDLAGRIPVEEEISAFHALPPETRRAQIVDHLLGSKAHAEHMSEIFDVVLMGRKNEVAKAHRNQRRADEKWGAFLETAFEKNRPWNDIVRQIIVARPSTPEDSGAEWFLYNRRDNHQAIAEAIAPIAFGVNVKCAQCHGHPLAPEIEQRHYWGIVAAFNRSKNVDAASGRGISESAIGGFVNFADLRKRTIPAELVFPNGKSVPEKRPAPEAKEEDKPEFYSTAPPREKEKAEKPAVPKFSRREELARVVCENNPMLAKAFVNRLWAMLIGRGLVHPVESLDSRHPATHPELLEFLAADFAKNHYDIRRLTRAIVLSRAYQLDSKGGSAKAPPQSFSRALDKPLSAEVLHRSIVTAATGKTNSTAGAELRATFVERFPDLFAAEYNTTLHQATFFSNNPKLDELIKECASRLKDKSRTEQVNDLFKSLFNRLPDRAETSASIDFLKSGPVEQLLWTLLASAEFQFNH